MALRYSGCKKKLIYSPNQILWGSLLGGPLAATYFLRNNYLTLDRLLEARQVLLWGIIFTFLLLTVALFFTDNFPRAVPLAYSWTAYYIAKTYQLDKASIVVSEQFTFHSNWRVLGLAIANLLLLVIVLLVIVALPYIYILMKVKYEIP
jgi:hypothetical protein